MLVATIGVANILISTTSTSVLKNNLTLTELAVLNYASAEDPDNYGEEATQSAWSSFWSNLLSNLGGALSNVWNAVTSFCSSFFNGAYIEIESDYGNYNSNGYDPYENWNYQYMPPVKFNYDPSNFSVTLGFYF